MLVIFRDSVILITFYKADEDISLQENSSLSTAEPSMFPVLLPESQEEKAKLSDLITDFDEGNKSDRINRWMRYQLQTSPLEVELLVRVSFQLLHLLGLLQWQICVLEMWAKDGTNKSNENFVTAQTHSSAQESHPSIVARGRPHALSTAMPIGEEIGSTTRRRAQSCPSSFCVDTRQQDNSS